MAPKAVTWESRQTERENENEMSENLSPSSTFSQQEGADLPLTLMPSPLCFFPCGRHSEGILLGLPPLPIPHMPVLPTGTVRGSSGLRRESSEMV